MVVKRRSRRRKTRVPNKPPTIGTILQNKTKRARLVLLLLTISFIGMSLLLPKSSPETPISPPQSDAPTSGSFATEPVTVDKKILTASKTSGKSSPERILIPAVALDLAVKEARVVHGYWEVFSDRAGFGAGSAHPGEVGNQVIFAHARKGLFEDLPKVKVGDIVYVLSNSNWYRYRVSEKKEVVPKQIEVIAPTADETLTLYTCSGFADSKRLIVIAKPAKT